MWHDIAPDAATAALAVIGALHVAWAFTPWPAPTYQALSKYVYGGPGMPPKQACITVGALLIAAAYGVLAVAGPRRGSARRGCTGSECGPWPRAAGDLTVLAGRPGRLCRVTSSDHAGEQCSADSCGADLGPGRPAGSSR